MNTIKNYLENMFMNLPLTPEVKRAKEELLQMMEDKYNELKSSGKTDNEAIGIVISEFGNLEEVAEELGIAEYLNGNKRDEQGEMERIISLEEAQEYLEATGQMGSRIGIGVTLCIWSPILLLVLGGIADGTSWENVAGGIGLLALLILAAPAVAIFIFNGMQYEKYENLKKEPFTLGQSAMNYVQEEREGFRGMFALSITMGVVLCIIGVIPISIGGIFGGDSSAFGGIAIGILLFLVSIGVFLFIYAGTRQDAYNVLLQKEEYQYEKKLPKDKKKKAGRIIGAVGGVYWSIITCIYLGWSFFSWNWGTTWIIWPVTGILFGAFTAIINAVIGLSE